MKAFLLISAAAAASTAATLGAQAAPTKPDSACTTYPGGRVECRVYRGAPDSALRRIFFRTDSALAKRAALGIEVRPTGTRRDTLGVFVNAVTPKGPAETAGIVEGDRIASINGVDLRTTAADTEDSYIDGLAAHRLTREVQKLSPGARVTLRVYSGGRFRDVQVTAGRASEVMRFGSRIFMPGMGGGMRWEGGPDGAMMFGPDLKMMREWQPLMKEKLEPMLRERLRDLPRKIQLGAPMRIKTFEPSRVRTPRVYKVEGDLPELDEPFLFELDDDFIPLPNAIEVISPDEVRELAASAIRDARVALKQLSEAGIA